MNTKTILMGFFVAGIFIAGCTAQLSNTPGAKTKMETAAPVAQIFTTQVLPQAAETGSASCQLPPIVIPTLLAEIPGYTELDESTGLHVTGKAEVIDLASYQLMVTGLVDHPLSLNYDELRCMPKVSAKPLLICPGYFEDQATWSGVPLKTILNLAGIQSEAKRVVLISGDGYESSVTLEDGLKDENFLAYELEGNPVPILHGFPLRAIFPSMSGNRWTKWLVAIRVE